MSEPESTGPPPRRAGWVRVALFLAAGAALAAMGEYAIAAIAVVVAAVVWWIDRGIASRGKP